MLTGVQASTENEHGLITHSMQCETLWIASNLVFFLDSLEDRCLLEQLWYQNASDLTMRAPSSLFDLLASMMAAESSTASKDMAIQCICNILYENENIEAIVR